MKYSVLSIINFHSGINWYLDSPLISADADDSCSGIYVKIAGWMFSREKEIRRAALYSELFYRSPLNTAIPFRREDVSNHFDLGEGSSAGFNFDLNLMGFDRYAFIYLCAVSDGNFHAFSQDAGFFAKNFEVVACIQLLCEPGVYLRTDPPEHSDEVSPLFVTSLGRSGTTALMSCLGESDCVASSRNYPFESAPLSYYIHLARVSVTPSSNDGYLASGGYLDMPFLASTNPFIDSTSYRYLYDAFAESGVDMCGIILDAVIKRLASPAFTSSSTKVRYISEKLAANTFVATFSEIIWPNTTEILLVRSFDSWLRSALAFSISTGNFFGSKLEEFSLEQRLIREVGGFINYASFRSARAHVIKYENLMKNDAEIRRLCHKLSIPLTAEMLSRFNKPKIQHVTGNAEVPDIYRRMLSAPRIVELRRKFNEVFGYS